MRKCISLQLQFILFFLLFLNLETKQRHQLINKTTACYPSVLLLYVLVLVLVLWLCKINVFFSFLQLLWFDINAYLSECFNGEICLGCQWNGQRTKQAHSARSVKWMECVTNGAYAFVYICIICSLFIHAEPIERCVVENKTGECQHAISCICVCAFVRLFLLRTIATKEWHQLLWF